jgi:hypothetical protein
MKREQVIAMAREAGMPMHEHNKELPFLERFAAKCEAVGYEKGVAAFLEAVKLEREQCAREADFYSKYSATAKRIAEEIRSRGNDA